MITWTEDQKKAIDLRNSNLLVSAAAGSGKTAVLVERIINIVKDDKIDIDKLLIVTFTNAAANGMKQKIQKALTKEIECGKGDVRHLRKQLHLLSKAQISTIHSFCIDVVRKNFHNLDIDPNFRIGDPNEIGIMLNEAVDEVLENAYSNSDQYFIKLVESFTGSRNDIELQEIIKDTYKFVLSFPEPLKWLENAVNMLNVSQEEIISSDWMKAVMENICILLEGALAILLEAKNICKFSNIPYLDTIEDDIQKINFLVAGLEISFDTFTERLYNLNHARLKTIRGREKERYDENIITEVKDLRKEYKGIIDNIKKILPNKKMDDYANELTAMYPVMNALYILIYDLFQVFSSKKLENSILDFSDVEHYTLKLLADEEVSNFYKNKFKYIFIDEYQDSNQVQETIMNKIKGHNNLFMVGDVKQSIYRFRLADPGLFIEKYRTYSKDGTSSNVRVDLMKNFRSRIEILNGINYVFNKIMSEKIGEIDYNEEAFLYNGMKFESTEDNYIELNIIDKNTNEEEIDEEIKSMKTAEIEARFAAKKIKELIGKNTYLPADKKYRQIEYKDIVILMRAVSSWSQIFEEVFFEENIPFYSDAGAGYFETIEIQIVINLLKLIDNIRQDIPLMSILRSPIGGFKTEDMIQIRASFPNMSYIDACYAYKIEYKDNLSKKLHTFFTNIDKWKRRSRYTKLNELIWQIIIDTGYYYFAGVLPNGKMRQANLRILTDKAFEYEKTSMRGLFNFLKYIEKLNLSSGEVSTAKILSENDNVTRLITIHKSKGLEFPVVILCGLNKKFNMKDTSKSILKHKKYGLAPKYIDLDNRLYKETLPRIALKNAIKIENLSEEMRVLYVALTRAVDKLILIGTAANIETKAKKWKRGISYYSIYNASSYLDWVCGAIYNHKDALILRNISEDDNCNIDYNDSKWNIKITNVKDIELSKNKYDIEKVKILDELRSYKNQANSLYHDEIEKRLNWKYKYNKSVDIPSKLTVTDLKKLKYKNIDYVKYKIPSLKDIPYFKEEKIKFTKQEIGTITHFVMQHIDLKQCLTENNIKQQVNKMSDKKLLTEKEKEVVNINKIAEFFKTEIGKRMLKSHDVKRETPFVIRKEANKIIENFDGNDIVLLQGIVDCYFYEENEIVLIDYKTDTVNDNNIDMIINQYTPQILSYKEALEKITGNKVKESYLYLFDISKALSI